MHAVRSDVCNAQLDCSDSTTVNGMEVTVCGGLFVECEWSDDAWRCRCHAGPQRLENFPGEGSDGWEVCTNAGKGCAGVIDLRPQVWPGG
jgi:hypothetical protein